MSDSSTQVHYLAYDIEIVLSVIQNERALFDALGATDRPGFHVLTVAVTDLTWQVISHAAGVVTLLQGDFVSPLCAVQRALFEAFANLAYLFRHDDRETEAQVFQAYTYLKDMEDFPLDASLTEERQELLARLPERIVATARARAKTKPWTWSGKNLKEVAREGGIEGFDGLYAYLSGRAHAARLGQSVRFGAVAGNTQAVTLGEGLPLEDTEIHACAARRALRDCVGLLCRTVAANPIIYTSPNPSDFWNRQP
ncbi:MAG TPA: DUF5677 domain-containing protein [Gemmatimonadales bacterium]|jgi:hypothetical protein